MCVGGRESEAVNENYMYRNRKIVWEKNEVRKKDLIKPI